MKQLFLLIFFLFISYFNLHAQNLPLPEHPRPDFERMQWLNLNGVWQFEFDSLNVGKEKLWFNNNTDFSKKITVPFPWGSNLSGIKDEADIAWYSKSIVLDNKWNNKRVFITIGASDWETEVWFDGHYLGKHQGGYTPFSFELTKYIKIGVQQNIVIRVDDVRRDFTLYGKQGYGNARGIWQTVYLEAMGKTAFDYIHFTPDIDNGTVNISARFKEKAAKDVDVEFSMAKAGIKKSCILRKGKNTIETSIKITNPILWTLQQPYLYDVVAKSPDDEIRSYFGMRKISVVNLPNTDIPYIALNNEPIYVQLTLDQSYHPDGFYTFPSDDFMKNEIQLCKDIGLNGLRVHIKCEIPRKLYWADKLGLLVMADLPNSWGDPDEAMQMEAEKTLREMIKRDYNHPSIFSWIIFNETWGLRTHTINDDGSEKSAYLPQTMKWVESMYHLCKSLDPTRLAEDNSICCGAGHTVTDINSWHEYLPGYKWEEHMQKIDAGTYPGSTFHFEKGYQQGNQPMINSECGNVWGYDGSTGDVDWSYDYHRMMNTFRMHPKMAGWLYTEHHDVINEWNGYWRFDRSKKITGLSELGMEDQDLHSLIYLSNGQNITYKVKANAVVDIPMFMSNTTSWAGNATIEVSLNATDYLGNKFENKVGSLPLLLDAWMQKKLDDFKEMAPATNGIYQVRFVLKDESGKVLHRNFVSLIVEEGESPATTKVIEVSPKNYTQSSWSTKQWSVLDGKKMNGAGKGFFEYTFTTNSKVKKAYLLFELGAKQLFVKDMDNSEIKDDNYMLGAKADPSQNPNSYPMSDTKTFQSKINIYLNGKKVKEETLLDDAADHRGVLSWYHQLENGKLNEAGSFGQLIKIELSDAEIKQLNRDGSIKVKMETQGEGGIAVYGKEFGRYGFGPGLVVE